MAILISPTGEISEFCSHVAYQGETSLITFKLILQV